MRTDTGELIAKPFGRISGPYALSKLGERYYRLAQATSYGGLILWIISQTQHWLSVKANILSIAILIIVPLVLSRIAQRNGHQLSVT